MTFTASRLRNKAHCDFGHCDRKNVLYTGIGRTQNQLTKGQDIICNVKSQALMGAPWVHPHQFRFKALILTKSFVDFFSPMTDRVPEMINCSDKRKMLSGQFQCTKWWQCHSLGLMTNLHGKSLKEQMTNVTLGLSEESLFSHTI